VFEVDHPLDQRLLSLRDFIEGRVCFGQSPQETEKCQVLQSPADGHLRDLNPSSPKELPYRVQ